MKDNDIFYCSFLRSLKDTVEVRQSLSIEEIISHLYELVKSFQIWMGISRWGELYNEHRSLALKLFNVTFYINVYFIMAIVSGQNCSLKLGALRLNRRCRSMLSCSDVRTLQCLNTILIFEQHTSPSSCSISSFSGYLSLAPSWQLYVCARGWPGSGKADRLLWLEVRWINVSALLWCRACFPIACLWLIKHIDWPVSGLEGWPAAALRGTTSPPFLSLSWRLKGEGNTGWKVMSAQ